MRKDGVNAVVYMKRHATVKAKRAVLSNSGAILINDAIEPEFIDTVTIVHPVTGREELYYDSGLVSLYPWRMFSRDPDPNDKVVSFARQPKEPSAREVRQILQGSDHVGVESAKFFGEGQVELIPSPDVVGAFNCPGCIEDDRTAGVAPAQIRKNPIMAGQTFCTYCNRKVEYRRWKLVSEANYPPAEASIKKVTLVPRAAASPGVTGAASPTAASPGDAGANPASIIQRQGQETERGSRCRSIVACLHPVGRHQRRYSQEREASKADGGGFRRRPQAQKEVLERFDPPTCTVPTARESIVQRL